MSSQKATKNTSSTKTRSVFALLSTIVAACIVQRQLTYSRDPFIHLIPNLLFCLTPFRRLTQSAWKHFVVYPSEKQEPTPIPEMSADEYSYDKLRELTDNFRNPAVVRGLFVDAPATQRWAVSGYLSQNTTLRDWHLLVVDNAQFGGTQKNRTVMRFRDVMEEIITDEDTKKYLFFPQLARDVPTEYSEDPDTKESLKDVVHDIVTEDLDLQRIFEGFGTKSHRAYLGSQMIAGRGKSNKTTTTGTGWHCAGGNNWFIQVAGKKRWYFLDQKYSAYMQPLRLGVFTMQTGTKDMAKLQQYLPVKYTDLKAGDLLYNPDWEWHTIINHDDISIGVAVREVIPRILLRSNLQFTLIGLANKFLFQGFGITYGF